MTKHLRTITQFTHTVTSIVKYTPRIIDLMETTERLCIDTTQCLSSTEFSSIILSNNAVTKTTITCVNSRRIQITEIITIIIKCLTTLKIQIEARLCQIGYCSYYNLIGNPISLHYQIHTIIYAYIERCTSYTIRTISILITELKNCAGDIDIYCIPDLEMVTNCLAPLVPIRVSLLSNDTLAINAN